VIAKLWRWLFGGCEHKWALFQQLEWRFISTPDTSKPNGYHYVMKCEKCGRLEKQASV